MNDDKKLTTNAGAPVPDNQNVMNAGPRGPALLQDVWYLEKLPHFDREVDTGAAHACQGFRRLWHLYRYQRHYEIHAGENLFAGRKEDVTVCPVHHRRRRARCVR